MASLFILCLFCVFGVFSLVCFELWVQDCLEKRVSEMTYYVLSGT